MAAVTRRTLSKVKSSAIRPRQPSVPNLIWLMAVCRCSTQLVQFLFVQMLHYFSNILRLVERCDEQSIFGFDNYQVANTHQGDKFARSEEHTSELQSPIH